MLELPFVADGSVELKLTLRDLARVHPHLVRKAAHLTPKILENIFDNLDFACDDGYDSRIGNRTGYDSRCENCTQYNYRCENRTQYDSRSDNNTYLKLGTILAAIIVPTFWLPRPLQLY